MSFESYYDAHWLPLGDYFAIHRSRFLQSFKARRQIHRKKASYAGALSRINNILTESPRGDS